MPLSDPMREAFCVGIARLKLNAADAVRHAGYEVKNPRQKGWVISQQDDVKARIAELQEEVANEAVVVAADIAIADELEVACAGLEPGSKDWVLARHRINLRISEARKDTKETRATLIEIAQLNGHRVERQEVTSKTDALTVLSATEIDLLRAELRNRMALLKPAMVIDAKAQDADAEGGSDA